MHVIDTTYSVLQFTSRRRFHMVIGRQPVFDRSPYRGIRARWRLTLTAA